MKTKLLSFAGSAWGQRVSILAVIAIIMAIMQPRFFSLSNAYSILLAISIYGIMACGMLFVILIGGIDLSVGSTAAMAGCVMSKTFIDSGYTSSGLVMGMALALGLCLLLGLFHGIEVTFFKMPAFVVTLATQYAIYGGMQIYTQGRHIMPQTQGFYYLIGNGKLLGIPMPIVLFVIYSVICAAILGLTTFGRRVYAVGGNPLASELAGVKSRRYQIISYIICSFSAGFGGIVLSSLNMLVTNTTAAGYEGNVLMAMVIGGINLAGGEGTITGVIFGALLAGIINNILVLLDVPSDYQKFMQGVIIIAAIAMNMYTKRRSAGISAIPRLKPGAKK